MKKVFLMCVASSVLILASCGGKDEKGSDASKDANASKDVNAGKGGASGGDICECLMSAKSEDDAKKCDPSKSIGELTSIAQDCASKMQSEMSDMPDMPEMPE